MRTNARECAYKIIFANLFHPADDATKRSVYKANELSEEDAAFADKLVDEVTAHLTELCEINERMFPADKSALLLALAEINYVEDVPDIVAVDEAVGLSKRYSTEKSTGFINGILAAYLANEKKGN